jgi:hypothetical protein
MRAEQPKLLLYCAAVLYVNNCTQRLAASLEEARVSRERCRKLSEDCRAAAEREERLRRQLEHLHKVVQALRTAAHGQHHTADSTGTKSSSAQNKVS